MIQRPEDRPTVLHIADERLVLTYAEAAGVLEYNHISVFDEWVQGDEIVRGTAGPLNADFVRALMRRQACRYDCVVVDCLCDDLVDPLRQGGYRGPIIGIIGFDDQIPDEEIHPKLPLSDRSIDYFAGRPMRGANASVGVLPIEDFTRKLQKTLNELVEKR